MFESIINFFKKIGKHDNKEAGSKDTAKDRLHLVLMQDRANVSADFLELMKQEILDVIKKYIEVEEGEIDVRLTNEVKEDGTTGAPSLYANIPIINIRNDMKKDVSENKQEELEDKKEENENKENTEEEKKEEVVEEINNKNEEEKENNVEEVTEENKEKEDVK